MTAPSVKTKPPAVLLVDDDADTRIIVRDAFEQARHGWQVCEVSSGEEALDFLYRRGQYADAPRPDLIYLDIEMPGMGGQAALARIRQDEDLADIPIIMMTAMADDIQKRLAATNGANSYTVKPATLDEINACVLQVVEYWTTVHQRPEERRADA